ncbi:MAG TPA: phosphoribosylformylglycinamidine synthase subunit PurL [Acidimicrobiales bacterium]|jgi:phosphoribosylformylglycinamidine synthase|nr:phosphoribosylformylglycinamidine synthase subunit PurL [Acidimicrobiales bacterium]
MTPNGDLTAHRASRAHIDLGLTDDELSMIENVLERAPNDLELAMYSVMWSEHCSYKSSRVHLGRLPTDGPAVLVGPGENAGVIDVGDGVAIALRIESHNHPSFIEPFQGAATGVGGILRDIFTMGARPIAIMDPLFIGPLEDARSRYVLDGVVRGIAGYGNSVGVPTVGGQITFDHTYRSNPLVNVFCLGILPIERLVLGQASGVGNLAILLGSRTGRDGIGGVSVLASTGFVEDAEKGESKRPSVQVGDPYEEKRLIEACLELLDRDLVVGIQDLGGAGITCATSETASRAGLGMDVDVDAIPRREPEMVPVEVLTSESQERMLAIVEPQNRAIVEEVCRRWEVEASTIGVVRDADRDGVGRLRIRSGINGPILADVPASSLAEDAPKYRRPLAPPLSRGPARPERALPADGSEALLAMLIDPGWISEQYDHQLFLNTILGPGEGDAALLRLNAPGVPHTDKALGISADANPRWCAIDPRQGTAATVAESALNVACVGATPAAIVNCLNFGNPEHPSVMWQLSEAVDGMRDACLALDLPVVGGNVSLYNESDGVDIDPTPVIATVGVLDEIRRRPPAFIPSNGDTLVLLGPASDDLAGSAYSNGRQEMPDRLPPLDLALHARLIAFVAGAVAAEAAESAPDLLHAVHDVSDGGVAMCVAELATASGIGCTLDLSSIGALFSEAPSRVVVATDRPEEVILNANASDLPAVVIGTVGGGRVIASGMIDVSVSDLRARRSGRIPEALGELAGA